MDTVEIIDEVLDVFEEAVDVVVEVTENIVKRKSIYQKVLKIKCMFKFTCCSKSAETNHDDKMIDIRK